MSIHYSGAIVSSSGTQHAYQYRTMSVDRFPVLQEEIDALRRSGQLAQVEAFTNYMNDLSFTLPENFPSARSLILIATSAPLLTIHLQYNGTRIPAIIPPNYYFSGLTRVMLLDEIRRAIVPCPDRRVDRIDYRFFLKLAAVRSGLAMYGRNNICYVEGMGSLFSVHAYLTDEEFPEDHWCDVRHLPQCEHCSVCIGSCPTGAISPDRFVIDASRCIPLYNELDGELPDWIPAGAHHAIIGCMHCQSPCPANREQMKHVETADDITEDEVRGFISGERNENILDSIGQKLKIPYLGKSDELATVIRRNMKALVKHAVM